VGGKPSQRLEDRLGLLLFEAAAFLAVHQLHLVGESGRPGSGPPGLATLAAVGRAACGGLA
jgi:hypothetical protein